MRDRVRSGVGYGVGVRGAMARHRTCLLGSLLAVVPSLIGCGGSEPVGPGSPAQLGFLVSPTRSMAGVRITPPVQVAVQDLAGTTVPTAGNQVTLALQTAGAGALSGTLSMTAVNGVATFSDLSIDKADTGYRLTATASNLRGAGSGAFVVMAGSGVKLGFTAAPSAATVGAPIPTVQVAIQDAYENTVPSASDSVRIGLASGQAGGVLLGTLTVAAINGVASFSDLRIDTVGTGYVLEAAARSLSGVTSPPFAVLVPLLSVMVSTNGVHTCAITSDGASYCWGENRFGELGNGTVTDPTNVPGAVSGGPTFATLGVGGFHTCGVTTEGWAYCWGENRSGQLGNGTTAPSSVPVAVPGGLTFAMVTGAYAHTCALATDGAAYCWGDNHHGMLGDGTTATGSTVPVAVVGGLRFSIVSAQTFHTCGVTTDGAAYCWGENYIGQLGDGTTTFSSVPVPVSGGLVFATVSAGDGHSCGMTTAGAAYCWGENSVGQLGDGTTTFSSVPVPVSGGLVFATVGAGGGHSCGMTTAGAAYCWGSAYHGALGEGTLASGLHVFSSVPVAVSGELTFATVSTGESYNCGTTTPGVTYCWGENRWGQLGNRTWTSRATPVPVSSPEQGESSAPTRRHSQGASSARR